VRALTDDREASVAICDVSGAHADAIAVDALARVQLTVRRNGCQMRLRYASPELLELIALMGLGEVEARSGPVWP